MIEVFLAKFFAYVCAALAYILFGYVIISFFLVFTLKEILFGIGALILLAGIGRLIVGDM